MIWKSLFPALIMSSAFFNTGHLAAAQINEKNQSGCFLKGKVFNVVVDEEYSVPIRFGALEANSTKRDSVYFGMKEDDLHFGFTLSLNLTDPDHSRRLNYEIKNLIPGVRNTLPHYEFTRSSTDINGACGKEHFVIILPQAGNEFSFLKKEQGMSAPHGSGLIVEGHLISSHLSSDSLGSPDKKLRVSFSSYADRLMEKKLSNLEEQPEVPTIIIELEEGKMAQNLLGMSSEGSYHSAKMYEEKHSKVTRKDHKELKDINRKIEDLEKARVDLYKQVEDIMRDFENQRDQVRFR